MKQADLVVGEEYLISNRDDWLVSSKFVRRGRLVAVLGHGDVRIQWLNQETGEDLDESKITLTRYIRGPWAEAEANRQRNLEHLRQRDAERAAERAERKVRKEAVHAALGTRQSDPYRRDHVVVLRLEDAEEIVRRVTGVLRLPLVKTNTEEN